MQLKFDPADPKYIHITNREEAEKALDKLEKMKIVGVDIEATDLDPYRATLLTVQIGNDHESYIFNARRLDLSKIKRLKDFLENKSVIKILQNGKFDYKFIKHHLNMELENVYDTMLAEIILRAGFTRGYYSLKDLAMDYTQLDLEKAIRTTFEAVTPKTKLSEDQLKYAAIDTMILFPIFEAQLKKLQKENLIQVSKLEFATTLVVGDMELNGLYIDEKRWRKIIKKLDEKKCRFAQQFQNQIACFFKATSFDLFGNCADYINIDSQVQLMDLFNNKMGLNLPSTGDYILSNSDNEVVKTLRDYRKYSKLVTAFGEGLLEEINPITHRLHPEFNQLGTATGRFSCNKPNLQQIPRNSKEAPFRECFNPEPGYKLVTADYSSMEMRILAELSGDERMIGALNGGLDIHSYTASLMFGLPYSENFKEEHPDLRQIAKPIGFGLVYGMGPHGLASRLTEQSGTKITVEQAEEYMDKYFASYPSVKKYLEKTSSEAVKKGYSTTPAGRKRWYDKPSRNDPDYSRKIGRIQREAKNHPIQGTNADAIKYALVYLRDKIKQNGHDAKITHTVHDEIVCEVKENQAKEWAKIQSEEMVKAAKLFVHKVDIESVPFIGDVWEH